MRTSFRNHHAVALTLLLAACSGNTSVVNSWKDPAIAMHSYKRVLAVFISNESNTRRAAEDQLARRVPNGVPSYTILPDSILRDKDAAKAFVAARGHDLPEALRQEIVSATLAIVQDPRFAPLFQPGSLGEVPIVARFPKGDLSGQIDRLVVSDDALLVLDYKTNRPPPQTPEDVAPAYVAQLAAYRAALRLMFPGRSLQAALVWTDGPKLMEIPSNLLDRAEHRILAEGASLDVPGVRT